MELDGLILMALAALALWLGRLVHRRSLQQQPVHGGGVARFFNFLSGLCFVAILPTVCASVLFLHPELINVAGMTLNPLIPIVLGLAALSLLLSFLFALVEKAPAARDHQEKARRERQGWTEEDARSSGL